MNIALYIRLSKEDELSTESKSITSQRMYLKNFVKKFPYQNIYEYIDDGYSGTDFNRPSFKRLLKDIENKKINTVITKDSSRLGRNISWVTFYLEEYFPSKKIRYISIDDNYDSNNNSLETDMLIFKSLFNDYYCKDISKKIKSSLRIKKIEGKFTGWKAPYGYKRCKNDYHKLEIDNNVSNIVKEIFKLAYDGQTPSNISKLLNNKNIASPSQYIGLKNSQWTPKTIKDILENPTYIGSLAQGKRKKINHKLKQCINVPKEEWIIIENMHPPIIEKNIFDTVQLNLKKYHNIKDNKTNKKRIISLIYCKECNAKIGLNIKRTQSYCVCNNYKKNYKLLKCTPHTINYNKLEKEIIDELDQDINNINQKKINKLIKDKKDLEKQITKEYDYHKIKKLYKKLNDTIFSIKIEIKKQKLLTIAKKNKTIYLDMINKIYLSEDGIVELHLSYKK